VEPGTRIYGKSNAEWSAEWWKFVSSIPKSDNPLLHDDKCEVGQSGPVWFLTGKWGESPVVATRHCTVPSGKYLFVPVVSAFVDNVGYSPPKTVDEMRGLAREAVNSSVNTKCWLDGRDLQGLSSALDSPYRAVSPAFKHRTVTEDPRGYPAGTLIDPLVGDGIFLMLEPLAAGRHTIRVTGSHLAASYSYDITYQIDIVPPKK
jgi:hypothetical protein